LFGKAEQLKNEGHVMRLTQNQIEHLQDLLERGEITADQASVEKVKMARVQLVTCRIPAQVRKVHENFKTQS